VVRLDFNHVEVTAMTTPDDYEVEYMQGEGDILYREKVPVPKYFIYLYLMGLVSFATAAFLFFPWQMALGFTLFGAIFVFLGNMLSAGYRVVVSETGGVEVHAGLARERIAVSRIRDIEVASASLMDYPIGQGTVRRGTKGKAYVPTIESTTGVRLTLDRGSNLFLTSKRPELLKEAILIAQGKIVRASAAGDESTGVTFTVAEQAPAVAEVEQTKEEEETVSAG